MNLDGIGAASWASLQQMALADAGTALANAAREALPLEAEGVERLAAAEGATPLAGNDMPMPEAVQTQQARTAGAERAPAALPQAATKDTPLSATPASALSEPAAPAPAQMGATVDRVLAPVFVPSAPPAWPQAASRPGVRAPDEEPRRRSWRAEADDEDEAAPALPDALARPADATSSLSTSAWLAQLVARLRAARHDARALPSLYVAAEAWLRGRGALLAWPQAEGGEAAWVAVLHRAGGELPLAGRRFPALLAGTRVEGEPGWWAVRLVKTHGAGGSYQLATIASVQHARALAPGRVSVELQLGPVRSPSPRWQHHLLRVPSAQRFWDSLGAQWSWPLLLCDAPLTDVERGA